MKHRVGFNKLNRKTSHRKAMTRNMVTSLFRYERITTTKAKALEVRKTAEKMITRAKSDSVHNRRIINKDIKDGEILNKLFVELGPANQDRPGGYTRIIKTGLRKGDAAEMVILELVLDKEEENKKKKTKAKKKKAEAPVEKKTAPKEETKDVTPEDVEVKKTEVEDEAEVKAETAEPEAVEAVEVKEPEVVADEKAKTEEPEEAEKSTK